MINQALAQKLVVIAKQEITEGVNFKKPRLRQIQKFEDMYANKLTKTPKFRFNVPLPILSGYVDTLKSKIDNAPIISFDRREEADTKVAKKVSSMWETDSGEDRGRWAFKDRLTKNTAIFSGRGIYKIYSESDPVYKNTLESKDYYDFYCEPQGGPDLENHIFMGEQNIFRSKDQLIKGGIAGRYDKVQIARLLSSADATNQRKIQKDVDIKMNRSRALNLDANSNNFVGEMLFNLTEHYLVYEDVRYYLFFDEATGAYLRAEKLSDMYMVDEQTGDALWPYVSWATHEDNYNFWSKGPCDDVYPIADAMRIIFNESLNNLHKRNWDMTAYDSKIFPDPSKIQWRPDGLVEGNSNGSPLANGIYRFVTPDNTPITINLMAFVDSFMGGKTGVTPGAQGNSEKDKKVGVYIGEMAQVADRMNLTNTIYKEAWAQLGKRYLYGLRDHLNEKTAVKILGTNGVEWDELDKNEISDLNIKVSGGNDEAKFNELKNEKKIAALNDISANATLVGKINPNWLLEQKLKAAGYDADEIKRALDVNNFGDEDLMTEAAKAIQDIINGKTPSQNRGATTGFIQKIVDFAYDSELNDKVFNKLTEYANSHITIATDNMARKAQSIIRERNLSATTPLANNMPGGSLAPAMDMMAGANNRAGQLAMAAKGGQGM